MSSRSDPISDADAVAPEATQQNKLKQALAALRKMRVRLEQVEAAHNEAIAVIGMGCRFPGGIVSPEGYWDFLRGGREAIGEVPPTRWDIDTYYDPLPGTPGKICSRRGAFLDDIDLFDAAFFSVSPREAARMDPQQRILLEVAWEAFEHAGQDTLALRGTRTGVFVGGTGVEYESCHREAYTLEDFDYYTITGTLLSFLAGRISFVLGLHGPSLTLNTACSSSLVAVHLACQALRSGECELAVAGGVNLMLDPETSVTISAARALAVDGRCKAFDKSADGYVRGEGCGLLVLKPLSKAERDGDAIHAVIRATAVNHDGPSSGLTVPNGTAQQALIRAALALAGRRPEQIGYVEAHGAGTAVGDPIEAKAVASVLCEHRRHDAPLYIGSVKTNFGHTEAAAGIAGAMKVILGLKHKAIPPNLNLTTPTPMIDWSAIPLRVPTSVTPWPDYGGMRIGGVNSFGFSGTNAHVLFEEYRPPLVQPLAHAPEEPIIIPLSARNASSLNALIGRYDDFLGGMEREPEGSLADLARCAALRRGHLHGKRAAIVAATWEEARTALRALRYDQAHPLAKSASCERRGGPDIVFVFSGHGSQWAGMGAGLYARSAPFREAIDACDAAVSARAACSIRELVTDPARGAEGFDRIDILQPLLFSFQYALTCVWRSWGITPTAVVGHSLGEVAAACAVGSLTLAEGAAVVCARSTLLATLAGTGAMATFELSLQNAQELVAGYRGTLGIAASNGPTSTVISGDPDAIDAAIACSQQNGIFASKVAGMTVAAHSPHVDRLLDPLEHKLAGLEPRPPVIPFLSTARSIPDGPSREPAPRLDCKYWRHNLRETVLLWPRIEALAAKGPKIFLEVSPHPVLLYSIELGLKARGLPSLALPSLRRDEPEAVVIRQSLAALYAHGVDPDWKNFYPERGRFVSLPRYPWDRERFWVEASNGSTDAREKISTSRRPHARGRSAGMSHPLKALGGRVVTSSRTLEFDVCSDLLPSRALAGGGRGLISDSFCLRLALEAVRDFFGTSDATVLNFNIHELEISASPGDGLRTHCEPHGEACGTVTIEYVCRSLGPAAGSFVLATGYAAAHAELPQRDAKQDALGAVALRCIDEFSFEGEDPPKRQSPLRPDSNSFATERYWKGSGEALGLLSSARDDLTLLLDAGAQVACGAIAEKSPAPPGTFWRLRQVGLLKASPSAEVAAWVHVMSLGAAAARIACNLHFLNRKGDLLSAALGCVLIPAMRSAGGHAAMSSLRVSNASNSVELHAEAVVEGATTFAAGSRAQKTAPSSEPSVRDRIHAEVARVLGLAPTKLDPATPLTYVGLTSLMVFELRNWFRQKLGIALNAEVFAQPASTDTLVLRSSELLGKDDIVTRLESAATEQPSSPLLPAQPQGHHAPRQRATLGLARTRNAPPQAGRWILPLVSKPNAEVRLLCFPFAGGSAAAFAPLASRCPPEIDLAPIQLPGRDMRRDEPFFTAVTTLIHALADGLTPAFERPFAFFAHSLGGLVAFELCRELRRRGGPLPLHIFTSASRAPQAENPHSPIHRLCDAAFVAALDKMNGTPREILEDTELMQLFLPSLRADFQILETYIYRDEPPLDVSITSLFGRNDKIREPEVAGWKEQTVRNWRAVPIEGAHFYLKEQRDIIMKLVCDALLRDGMESRRYLSP